ncbi:MAG: hypothetical protein GY943_34105 [Chloroflexi bacterium]|nr:hypothetical protein [Chloroflexota bacterium]
MIRSRFFFIGLAVTTIGLAAALHYNWIPLLQSGYGWDWHYTPPTVEIWLAFLPFLAALLLYASGLWWLRDRETAVFLTAIIFLGIIVCIAVLAAYGNPLHLLYERTVSANASGAFQVGMGFDSLLDGIRTWPEAIAGQQYATFRHMRLSPPGLPASYWLAGRLMRLFPEVSGVVGQDVRSFFCDQPQLIQLSNADLSASLLGVFSPLWAMSVVVPLYDIGCRLGSERSARLAATAWLLVPAVNSFLGSHNTPLPLVATLTLAAFIRGWTSSTFTRGIFWTGVSGFLTVVCLILNVSMVPIILLCGLLTLFLAAERERPFSATYFSLSLKVGLQYGFGLLVGFGLHYLIAGYHWWELLPTIMQVHLNLERPYLPWLGLHTRDMVLFFGIPFFLLWLVSAWTLPAGNAKRWSQAMLLTLVILILSGTAQGEVGRVWMFFMPVMLIPVGFILTTWFDQKQVIGVMSLQLIWLIVGFVVLRPTLTFQALPPTYEDIQFAPLTDTPQIPISAQFGDVLNLEWIQSQYNAQSNQITLHLGWKTVQQLSTNYLFSALPVAPDGTLGDGIIWLPFDFQYPTTCWHRNHPHPIVDEITLSLGENAPPGDYWISLSAFDLDEGNTAVYLPVTTLDGTIDEYQVGIGPITVP